MASKQAEITVCIPAYQAEAFIADTLRSVQAQSFPDLRVIVSIDKSDDRTEEICRSFARDHGFEVFVQSDRLGWTGNVNFLLEQVRSPYFCLLPHDDLLEPEYTQRLYDIIQANPDCIVAHADLQLFGANTASRTAAICAGTPLDRILQFFLSGAEALPLRGVTRSKALQQGLRLKTNRFEDYANEVIWVLDLLTMGDCLALPEPLYRKRIRPGSLVRKRLAWPKAKRLAALVEHFRQCLDSLSAIEIGAAQRQLLVAACLSSAHWRLQLDRFSAGQEPLADIELLLLSLLVGETSDGELPGSDDLVNLINSDKLKALTARLRFSEGLRLSHGNRMTAAQALFEEAVALDPGFFDAHERLAHCLASQRRHEETVRVAGTGAKLFTKDHRLLLTAARAEMAMQRLPEAEGQVREALKRAPSSVEGYELLNQLLTMMGRAEDAARAAERVSELQRATEQAQ